MKNSNKKESALNVLNAEGNALLAFALLCISIWFVHDAIVKQIIWFMILAPISVGGTVIFSIKYWKSLKNI